MQDYVVACVSLAILLLPLSVLEFVGCSSTWCKGRLENGETQRASCVRAASGRTDELAGRDYVFALEARSRRNDTCGEP